MAIRTVTFDTVTRLIVAPTRFAGLTLSDSDNSAGLTIACGTNLSANRNLTITLQDGNTTLGIGSGGSIAYIGTANAWADGVKQTFNPDNTNAGINVGSNGADPSAAANGDLVYNSALNALRARINGAWVSLGAGGSTISNPAIAYVRSNGNDGTGAVGNPALPFLTAGAAYAAGVAGGTAFGLDIGVGTFFIALSANFSALCKTVVGAGDGLTNFYISAIPGPAFDAEGTAGYNGSVEVHHLSFTLNASGNSVTVTDGNTYTAGNGGDWSVFGTAAIASMVVNGGSEQASVTGTVNGGGASLALNVMGSLQWGSGSVLSAVGGTPFGGGATGADGAITIDGVNVKNAAVATGDITYGNCSVPTVWTVSGAATDKGGNATW